MRTGRPVRSASRQVCTCRLMSSRAPNAPPTPPSVERTVSRARSRQAAICFAVLVQPLRGDVQLDAGTAGVGHGQRGLQTEERLVLHADLVRALDHDVADQRLVAAHDPLVADHVAVGMDRRVAAVDRAPRGRSAASSTSYSTTIASSARRQVSG